MKIILCVLSLFVALSLHSTTGHAQDFDELGLAIRPAIVEVTGSPGETISTTITLQNLSANVAGIRVGSRSLVPNDPQIDQNRRSDFDASQWVKSKEASLLLERGQSREITVDIEVPSSAGPGGHYALITLRTVRAVTDSDDASVSGSTANPELTTVLFVTVPGLIDEQMNADITQPRLVQFDSPFAINASYSNTGNIHVLSSTEVFVKTAKDDNVVAVIRPEPQLLLPNTKKLIETMWDPEGKYGQYYFELVSQYGSPNQTIIERSDNFWVLPSLPIFLFGIVTSLGVGFALVTVSRWRRATMRLLGAPIRLVRDNVTKEPSNIDPETLDTLSSEKRLKDLPAARSVTRTKKRTNEDSKPTIQQQREYVQGLGDTKRKKKKK